MKVQPLVLTIKISQLEFRPIDQTNAKESDLVTVRSKFIRYTRLTAGYHKNSEIWRFKTLLKR